MLTENEKRWLIKRAKKWVKFCDVCIVGNENCKLTYFRKKCPTNIQTKDLLEAAEFEQRVIVKLAREGYRTFMPCLDTADCPYWGHNPSCPWCRIKAARLAVEEEMDG